MFITKSNFSHFIVTNFYSIKVQRPKLIFRELGLPTKKQSLLFTECSPCARHCSNDTYALNPHNSPVKQVLLFPFNREGKLRHKEVDLLLVREHK